MAKGRFISNAICADKKINLLSDDTSRLAFTWLVTLADCEGRTYGDPSVLRSMLFPRRQDVTIERMEAYIKEWSDNGMVLWYEAGGDKWICFPNFDKHQVGLRKDREAPSIIPPYSEDAANKLRSNSGVAQEQVPVKLIKDKSKATPEVVLPSSLDCEDFKKAWGEWTIFRAETHHKLTPTTIEKQLSQLEKFPVETAIAMIDQSIEKGWQGLFEVKANGNNSNNGSNPVHKVSSARQAFLDSI